MSQKIKIIFTLSIILNVILFGVTTGGFIHKWQYSPWKHAREELAPESRHLVARSFQQAHKDMKSTFDKSKKLRNDLRNILAAEDFDEEKFEKTMHDIHSIHEKMMERKIEMMKELAAELPPEERAKLAGKFMRPYGGRGYKREGSRRGSKD